ncbi:collagen alpha-1(VII) chain-like isoform X1 [Canis lupus familiaris]|uniref:collagen alpha-1(VII) chain-like isoform X1 n=1 Tax=Canis lupus familiaris TaxID=9615 RepID=UPI0018F7D87A|nr:collagen alpha-1(VII) chain-like isoform X1 [Canis lupus familiaris]XP_038297818.1 collagen alpha-1(VII) chain-like isoform X1 [Canis lupus familiaris]XP_038297819.1 collagen alpha-1(VII) chain-like isoform X1 [Canis lupus familiaris]
MAASCSLSKAGLCPLRQGTSGPPWLEVAELGRGKSVGWDAGPRLRPGPPASRWRGASWGRELDPPGPPRQMESASEVSPQRPSRVIPGGGGRAACCALPARWLTLSLAAGRRHGAGGGVPGLSRALQAPPGQGQAAGSGAGGPKAQTLGPSPALASREACRGHHLLGSGREGQPAPPWGLAVTRVSCSPSEVSQYLQRSQKHTEPHVTPPGPGPACVGLSRAGQALGSPDRGAGGGGQLAETLLFSFPLHVCPLPPPSGWSWFGFSVKEESDVTAGMGCGPTHPGARNSTPTRLVRAWCCPRFTRTRPRD